MDSKKIVWECWEWDNGENEGEEDIHDDHDDESIQLQSFIIDATERKIYTPFGVYSEFDSAAPCFMFECWIGYTNFKLTEGWFHEIDNHVDGIGAFKVLTPYRFFIGVEKLFKFSDVRNQIESLSIN